MELTIFGRFHARAGQEGGVAQALREVAEPTRAEPGCLAYGAFRSTRDPQLFYVHSRWIDEAAFDRHAGLPHTVRFLTTVEPLIDHTLDVTRAHPIV
jgi:quinol monooxygenase YgiN